MSDFVMCPACGGENFRGGPEGGGSQDILCMTCGEEYCYSPFGLDKLGRDAKRAKQVYGVDPLPEYKENALPLLNREEYGLMVRVKELFK